MSLKARIDSELKAALLGGDRFQGDVLRGLKAAILNEEVALGKRDEGLDDASIEKLIAREVKKRNESAALYDQADRPELSENERKEAAILEAYLPEQVSEADIQKIINDTITAMGVSGPQAMGQVIGAVKGKLGNTADGAIVARLVKEALGA